MQLKMTLASMACVALPTQLIAKQATHQNTPKRPNVIFIYADDMGKGMISAYGQKIIQTPNMDRLVNQGVHFENAYGCHYSAPARASLLTGYSDCHKGHWQKRQGMKYTVSDTAAIAPLEKELQKESVVLHKGDLYLADVFNKAGYVTGEIGKLDYGFVTTRKEMKAHGWDHYYGYLDHGRCHGFYPPFLFTDGRIDLIKGNTRAHCGDYDKAIMADSAKWYKERWDMTGKKVYAQDIFDEKMIQFIKENKDHPFFLYHPSQLPHGPVGINYVDDQVKNNPNLTDLEKEYATMVLRLDKTIGLLLDELDKQGISQNTMVVFSADNGHQIYYQHEGRTDFVHDIHTGKTFDHGDVRYTAENAGDIFDGTLNWSGFKRSNLEGGVHVPLTFYWKGHLAPRACESVVSNYDFLSTMADMLNVSIQSQKDGISYLPLLLDAKGTEPDNRFVMVDSRQGPALIMNNGWKLRFCGPTQTYELYNLTNDPGENKNLAKQYPNKVAQMRFILDRKTEHTECRFPFPVGQPKKDLHKKKNS